MYVYNTFSCFALSRMRPSAPDNIYCAKQQTSSAVTRNRHVCVVTQQTCLLCHTDMSAV